MKEPMELADEVSGREAVGGKVKCPVEIKPTYKKQNKVTRE